MRDYVEEHLERVRVAVLKSDSAATIARWITEKTTYAFSPYSFKDHEFQEEILSDTAPEQNIRKCSQVGMSEASARMALALVNVLNPYTVIYTVPTAAFAGKFAKTRIDPVIEGSATMRANIHPTNSNNEVKQFGASFLWLRGAASSNAPISIPADHLIHDEVDFSDQEVLGQYKSRLTHSQYKRYTRLSTPTLPGFGIDLHFQQSRRHFNFVKCSHCNHQFVPDYYDHVKVPGYTGDLRAINKTLLSKIRWQEAALHCPKCGGVPSLQVEFREWVCENPSDNYVGTGHQVSPFDAPNIIKPSYLVEASTSYARTQDFVNFNLGLPMEDSEASLSDADFEGKFTLQLLTGGTAHVMGVDVGNVYHFTVAAVDPYDDMLIVHTEQVPMRQARKRYHELRQQYRVVCTVMDATPHSETVMALQADDPNLYASVYMRSKSILTHNVQEREEEKSEGQDFLRQVNVNRSKAFDGYMEFLRSNRLHWLPSDDEQVIKTQHKSMKRVKTFDAESGELVFSWQKSDGNDHYHHSHLYAWIASKIRGVGRPSILLPVGFARSMRTEKRQT